jgi:phosphoribosylanthranilate isomerase
VFAPSKRQVNAQRAADLARNVPAAVTRVAVMLHPAQSLVDEVWKILRPDVLQTDSEDLARLVIPQGLKVIPVVRESADLPTPLPQRLLFEGSVSGVGQTANWGRAAQLAAQTQLVLAGGLNPQNVTSAVARVRPYGVDVSSGVESWPGIKDVTRIQEFVRAARATMSGVK